MLLLATLIFFFFFCKLEAVDPASEISFSLAAILAQNNCVIIFRLLPAKVATCVSQKLDLRRAGCYHY